MTEANQKKLYEDFKKNAVEGKTAIQREHCKIEAAIILKSFPQFEVKEKPKTAAQIKAEEKEKNSKEIKEKK